MMKKENKFGKFSFLFVILLLGLSLFYSCGDRRTHKAGITFTSGAMMNKATGGLILVGERDTGEFFSTSIDTSSGSNATTETTIEIQGGTWDFYAMAWEDDDSQNFRGTVRCGTSKGYKIKGNDDNLSISLTKDNCQSDDFNSSTYRNTSGSDIIPRIKLAACSNLEDISSRSSTCNFPLHLLGSSWSFKLAMGGNKSATLNTSDLTELESECLTISGPSNPTIDSELRMGFQSKGPFGVKIKTYGDSSCTSNYHMSTVNLERGIGNSTNAYSMTYPFVSGSETRNTLFFPDNYIGYGTAALKAQTPTVKCQNSDDEWIHCFPGSTTQIGTNDTTTNYTSAKTFITNLLGTSDAVQLYSSNSSSNRNVGTLGEAALNMIATIGANLHKNGFTTCDSIAVGESQTMELPNGYFAKGEALEPKMRIPSHFTGGSNTPLFEKRIAFYLGTSESNMALNALMEFNCTSGLEQVGWYRSKSSSGDYEVELWYDTTNQSSAKLESYTYYKGDGSPIERTREVHRFHKTGADSFTSWVTGTVFKETSGTSLTLSTSDNLYTCTTSEGCTSTCYNQSGTEATCTDDVAITSSDSQSGINPILYDSSVGFTSFSQSSLAAGNQVGWSVLSPFTADGSSAAVATSGESGIYSNRYSYLIKGKMGAGNTLLMRSQLVGNSSSSSSSTTDPGTADGTVYSGLSTSWEDVWFEKCGNGTIGDCTEAVAKSSCTAVGKKLVSHMTDSNSSDVVGLYNPQGGSSCNWSIGWYRTTNPAFNTSGRCLIGIANSDWTSCCGQSSWHGRAVQFGSTGGGEWGFISSGNTGNQTGDTDTFTNSSSSFRFGCTEEDNFPSPNSHPRDNYLTSCTDGEYYVPCK